MDYLKKTIRAWQQAKVDLGINIRAPIILTTNDNRKIQIELLIENFGSNLGTIIISSEDISEIKILTQYGYHCSAFYLDSYAVYDRQLFIDTLNDWGYFGDKSKIPDWYTGKPWC